MGAILAQRLGVGFVMCRKIGKLPGETRKQSYLKEYGEDVIEIHTDAISSEDVVTHPRRFARHWWFYEGRHRLGDSLAQKKSTSTSSSSSAWKD